jgi:YesN/AraC family two-component response regulator
MLEDIKPYTKNLNILYVEDEADIREYLVPILEQLFNNVLIATNGEEGLDEYEDSHMEIDIVLTDISMPKLDGLEMAERIKEKKKDQHIIILSAHNDSEFLIKAIEVGVEYFVLKPIQYDKMFDVLKKTAKRIQDEIELEKHRIDKMIEDAKKATTLTINTLANSNPFPTIVVDEKLDIVSYNLEFFAMLNDIDEDLLIKLRDLDVNVDNFFAREEGFLYSDEIMNFKDKVLDFSELEPNKIKLISENNMVYYVKMKQLDRDELSNYYQICFIEENEYK